MICGKSVESEGLKVETLYHRVILYALFQALPHTEKPHRLAKWARACRDIRHF